MRGLITAQAEPFPPFLDEVRPLLPLHYAELALNQDKVPLDPQYAVYLERDARGEVMVITLREAGVLIGYFVGFVAPGLHYRTCLTLTMDIFYIRQDRRNVAAGALKLFRTVESEARRRGVQRIFAGSKFHKDASRIFKALRYEMVEIYFSKWIGA